MGTLRGNNMKPATPPVLSPPLPWQGQHQSNFDVLSVKVLKAAQLQVTTMSSSVSVSVCAGVRLCVCVCECMIKSEPHNCIKKVIKNNKQNCINFTSLSFSRCFRDAFVVFAFSLGVYFYDSYTHTHINTVCNVNLLQSWVCQLFRVTRAQIKCKLNFALIKCSYKTFKKTTNKINRNAFDINIPCTLQRWIFPVVFSKSNRKWLEF